MVKRVKLSKKCDFCQKYSSLTAEYPCGHFFCPPCGLKDLEEKVEDGESDLYCPLECEERLPKSFLREILSEEIFQHYLLLEKEQKKRERIRRLAELEREKTRLLAEEEREKTRLLAEEERKKSRIYAHKKEVAAAAAAAAGGRKTKKYILVEKDEFEEELDDESDSDEEPDEEEEEESETFIQCQGLCRNKKPCCNIISLSRNTRFCHMHQDQQYCRAVVKSGRRCRRFSSETSWYCSAHRDERERS